MKNTIKESEERYRIAEMATNELREAAAITAGNLLPYEGLIAHTQCRLQHSHAKYQEFLMKVLGSIELIIDV